MSKWVKQWKVPGSSGNTYTVSVDEAGNMVCSCRRWIFKKVTCRHMKQVKSGLFSSEEHRTGMPAMVGEVTIQGSRVLYPLVPFGGNTMMLGLRMTVVYDLIRANVHPDYVRDYRDKIVGKKVSFDDIKWYVQLMGRVVYSKFVKGRGWVDPIYVPADTPLKVVSENSDEMETAHEHAYN